MASRTITLASLLLTTLGCTTTTTIDLNKQADVVEAKLAELGEKREVAGTATQPTLFTFELSKRLPDGSYEWGLQEVAMVHVIAGNMNIGMSIYKVGLMADQPVIVCKTGLGSNFYDIVWESWPDGRKRAGSPAPSRLRFNAAR